MAFANSKVFRAFIKDALGRTNAFDLDAGADTPKVALYGNGITPDQDATSANTAYGAGQWVTSISDTNWPAAGRPLVNGALSTAAATVFYDADDTVSNGNVTLSAVFGCLVYDDTLASVVNDQGLCFNYFGGTQSVTAGSFTIVWHLNGLFRISL